jgi:lysylphosphatidylglycerol synthetase-like protein (DUF2156 family)
VSVPPTDGPPEPERRLRPMSPAALCAWAVVGLIAGWLFHRVLYGGAKFAPMVSWAQPTALLLVAAILVGTARTTRRSIRQHGERISPQNAVNRLVLARACSYVGSLMAGAYVGYAVSCFGVDSELAAERAIRSSIAGLTGLLVVGAGLLLERACRVPPEDDEP